MEQTSRKSASVALLAIAVISMLVLTPVGDAQSVSSSNIATYNQWATVHDCSYLVFKAGSTTYAKNCETGAIDHSSTSSATVLQNAIDNFNGAPIRILPGVYEISTTLLVGDGSASAASTDQRIMIIGSGSGPLSGAASATTELKWTGSSGGTLVQIRGPIQGASFQDIRLNGASSATTVLHIIADQRAVFSNLAIVDPQANGVGLLMTSVDHADGSNSDITFQEVTIVAQNAGASAAKIGTTGIVGASNRAGNSRLAFIDSQFYFASTSSSSYGIYLKAADNNSFIQCLTLPNTGQTSGYGVYFDQVAAPDDVFPHENVFYNSAILGNVGGTSGTGGNVFLPYPTSDGATVPTLANVHTWSYDGRSYIAGTQRYSISQIQEVSNQTSVTTTSNSFVDVPSMSVTITTKSNAKVDVTFTGRATKNTAGDGFFILDVDGSDQGVTQRSVGATGYYQTVTFQKILTLSAGSHTFKVQYKSDDANSVAIIEKVFTIKELY